MNERRTIIDDAVQARTMLDELDSARRAGLQPTVPFGRLYRYATALEADDPQIEAAIATDPRLASALERLLQRLAAYQIPMAAAAADRTVLDRRHGSGWTLRLAPASNGRQLWVIIDLEAEIEPPTLLFAGLIRRRLPPADNGHIQFRVPADDALAEALRQPANAIYLT